ncbi:hypothetical protein [Cohnella soli]|uniref:Uncharacterized protein n=1 Tax=Cohnella soli TaxID=425005 RepID=A0ABW0I582_9BACL
MQTARNNASDVYRTAVKESLAKKLAASGRFDADETFRKYYQPIADTYGHEPNVGEFADRMLWLDEMAHRAPEPGDMLLRVAKQSEVKKQLDSGSMMRTAFTRALEQSKLASKRARTTSRKQRAVLAASKAKALEIKYGIKVTHESKSGKSLHATVHSHGGESPESGIHK